MGGWSVVRGGLVILRWVCITGGVGLCNVGRGADYLLGFGRGA